jgi:hypothetical protein
MRGRGILRSTGRELLIFCGFLLVTIAVTWPLAVDLQTTVSDTGDPLLNAWIVDWDLYALTHSGASLFQANIFHPGKYPLAYSENLLGIALAVAPSYLAGASALTTYNIAMLLGFTLSAYGAFVLARKMTGSTVAAIVAGLLFGFVPFRFDHLAHLQMVWGGWLPLSLAALLHLHERPTRGRAVLFCLALVMNGATNVHWMLFGFFAIGMTIVFIALVRAAPAGQERRFWIGTFGALAVSVAILYPLLRPYQVVSKMYNMKRDKGEVLEGSANWTDWLVTTDRSAMYGRMHAQSLEHGERRLFPGLVALFLTVAAILGMPRREGDAIAAGRKPPPRAVLLVLDALAVIAAIFTYAGIVAQKFEWGIFGKTLISVSTATMPMIVLIVVVIIRLSLQIPSALARVPGETLADRFRNSRFPLPLCIAFLWIAIGVLGSFGLNAFFHTFLFHKVGPFRSIRAVGRWAMIAYVGLAGASAFGVVTLTRRLSGRWKHAISAALILLAANDIRTNIVWHHAIADQPPAHQWLERTSLPGPIFELPMEREGAAYYYLLWATRHHKVSMNGTSGFEPPVHWSLRERELKKTLDDTFTDILIANGASTVIVHEDMLHDDAPVVHAWLKRETTRGRLAFIGRFDHDVGGDWVFALTKNDPDWQKRRAPETVDGGGFTPSQNFARMLEGLPTYSNSTVGRVDVLKIEDGKLNIIGWATSPFTVREVIARFENGKRTFRLDRAPRGDVTALMPWYPDTSPGFQIIFPKRPRGVRRYTDLQIEIVDGRGQRTRLPSQYVQW